MKNSIIVPVFNRSDLTTVFIKSVGELLQKDDELIIVDNHSNDNTELVVRIYSRSHPTKNIRYIRNPENYGFGRANNIGAEQATGDNLIFISNDVLIHGDFIRPTETYLDAHTNDAVGARVIAWPTGWNDIWQEVSIIPYIEGWNISLRKSKFEMVGGFDPEIFIDYDDICICHKLHLAGVGLAQITLPIFHPYSGSSFNQLSQARLEYTEAAIAVFGRKWGYHRK